MKLGFAANTIHIAVFGAGHVGQTLIPMLAGLPCRVTWVDNRETQFPANCEQYANVTKLVTDDPSGEVSAMASNTLYVVMTHNHQLDFDISLAILKREDFHYLGLIASDTKWRRFQQRYKHREVQESLVQRMNCPIGLEQVVGKIPMEVAISVAGQLIESYQTLLPDEQVQNKNKGVAWKEITALKHLRKHNVESVGGLACADRYCQSSMLTGERQPWIMCAFGANSDSSQCPTDTSIFMIMHCWVFF